MAAIPGTVERILEDAERSLIELESDQIKLLSGALLAAEQEMEAQLRKFYGKIEAEVGNIEDKKRRAARIERLLVQQRALFQVIDQAKPTISGALRTSIEGSYREGLSNAGNIIGEFEFDFPLAGTYDQREVDASIKDSLLRYSKYSDKFKDRAKTAVASGLLQGKGMAVTARRLQQETGILISRATNIVRTETVNAQDSARKSQYKSAGIDHVQRLATLDGRVCKWCAWRHGKIYPIDKAHLVLHGHDRCTHIPIKPEWIEAGYIDLADVEKERQAYLQQAGVKRDPGPAPFEKTRTQDFSHSAFSRLLTEASQAAQRDPSVDRKIRAALRDGEAALASGDKDAIEKVLAKIHKIDPDIDKFPSELKNSYTRLFLAAEIKGGPSKVKKGVLSVPQGMEGSRVFETDRDAVSWSTQQWEKATKALTEDQIEALRLYQGAGYQGINPLLRGTRTFSSSRTEELRQMQRKIDRALDHQVVPEDIIVYRAVSRDAFPEMSEKLSGQVFIEKAYMSTAVGAKPPREFSKKDVVMRIRVPAGTPGYFMPGVATDSRMRSERELLIGRGQEFVIHETKYNSRTGKWLLDVEIRPKRT